MAKPNWKLKEWIYCTLNQPHKTLKTFIYKVEFAEFYLFRARLAWVINKEPDICYSTAASAQVTEEAFEKTKMGHIKKINSVVSHLSGGPNFLLEIPNLYTDFL